MHQGMFVDIDEISVMLMQVIVPMLPVTGMRLHLEGKKNNR